MIHQRNKAKKCFDRFPGIQKIRYSSIAAVMLIGSAFMTSNVSAAEPGMEELKKVLQGQIELMTAGTAGEGEGAVSRYQNVPDGDTGYAQPLQQKRNHAPGDD